MLFEFENFKRPLSAPHTPKPDHLLSANISHLDAFFGATLAHLLLLSEAGPKLAPIPIRTRRCLMGRRLRADVDQRQLGLFGESLTLGMKPKAVTSLPTALAEHSKSDVSLKNPPAPVKVEPPPRKSLALLPPEVVRPVEAASLLSVSLSLLKKWRMQGDGPRYVRLGGRAIGYRRTDLSDWIAARTT
jgi:predicted DNA-binding transcriptional regulator AlpA